MFYEVRPLSWALAPIVHHVCRQLPEHLVQCVRITERELPGAYGRAWKRPSEPPRIELNPLRLQDLPDSAKAYVVAHEFAHIYQEHTEILQQVYRTLPQAQWADWELLCEFAADAQVLEWGFRDAIAAMRAYERVRPLPNSQAWQAAKAAAVQRITAHVLRTVPASPRPAGAWKGLHGVAAPRTATFKAQIKAKGATGGTILITNDSLDRDNDRVMPSGARLENYLNNPVVLWGHDYQRPESVIGRTVNLQQVPNGILADFELRPASGPADPQVIVLQLWEGGWVNTASIGFKPKTAVPNERGGLDFTSWELLEWSLVPVPANAGALRV